MSSINKIKQYILQVKNISPLRIGNGEEEGNGLLISDKHAVINGTTLSGLFRDFLKNLRIKMKHMN
ncbi:CRISPR-associated RAMP protein [Clostridium botulinum A1 str. CFSAN002368]|nr:CRISPR-associated RAMP protein [Clostridium botulinum A1 str. CFSAN002368]